MCGIIVEWQFNHSKDTKLIASNRNRGPDFDSLFETKLGCYSLVMRGFVLHLRGSKMQPQPLKDKNGNVLVFNGEIYDGLVVAENENDTFALSNKLQDCNEEGISQVLSSICGEWAFAYYHAQSQLLYFGRDFLGKRSLLWHKTDNSLILATTSGQENYPEGYWEEVPTTGIFKASLKSTPVISHLEWNSSPGLKCPQLLVNSNIPHDIPQAPDSVNFVPIDDFRKDIAIKFQQLLDTAVKKRIESIPAEADGRLGILFSGGVDCIVLAALSHNHVPANEPIDLLNVAFENPRSLKNKKSEFKFLVPDRITGKQGLNELQKLYPTRKWRFVEVNVDYNEFLEFKSHVMNLMRPLHTVMDLVTKI